MIINRIFISIISLLLLSSCLTISEQIITEKPITVKQLPEKPAKLQPENPEETIEPTGTIDPARQEDLDARARKAPSELKQSIQLLAAYLAEPCRNDMEKTRMIFVWISENIAYDTDAFFYGKSKPQTGESVLVSGMAVCAGYSDIFKSLGDEMGLEIISISGHGKGYSYFEGAEITQNHAWTAVRIEQRWVLIDSTWGAGYVGKDKKFHRSFAEYWFDVDPEIMIFTHLPWNSDYQFTKTNILTEQYSALPNIKPDVFINGITPELVRSVMGKYQGNNLQEIFRLMPLYFEFGLSEQEFHTLTELFDINKLKTLRREIENYLGMDFSIFKILNELQSPDYTGLVKRYSPPGGRGLSTVNLPVKAILKRDKKYTFEYIPEKCLHNAIIYNNTWHFALKDGEQKYGFAGIYDGTIDSDGTVSFTLLTDKPGSLKIVAQPSKKDPYGTFLEYTIQ